MEVWEMEWKEEEAGGCSKAVDSGVGGSFSERKKRGGPTMRSLGGGPDGLAGGMDRRGVRRSTAMADRVLWRRWEEEIGERRTQWRKKRKRGEEGRRLGWQQHGHRLRASNRVACECRRLGGKEGGTKADGFRLIWMEEQRCLEVAAMVDGGQRFGGGRRQQGAAVASRTAVMSGVPVEGQGRTAVGNTRWRLAMEKEMGWRRGMASVWLGMSVVTPVAADGDLISVLGWRRPTMRHLRQWQMATGGGRRWSWQIQRLRAASKEGRRGGGLGGSDGWLGAVAMEVSGFSNRHSNRRRLAVGWRW